MNPTQNPDALGYVDELRKALQSPHLQLLFDQGLNDGRAFWKTVSARFDDSAAIQRALETLSGETPDERRWEMSKQLADALPDWTVEATAVVSALGFCRLFAIDLPSDVSIRLHSPLPAELLVPAIVETLRLLDTTANDARSLPLRFDNAEPLEDRSLCTSILHSLMELWAVFIVVDDEYQLRISALQGVDSAFRGWMRRLLGAFADLDDAVQRDEQICLLSVATELPLLENWRKMLAQPYREPLPWWLDGTLEDAATRVRHNIMSAQIFGQGESKFSDSSQASSHPASTGGTSGQVHPVGDSVLAAAPGGLLGEVTNVVVKAATMVNLDPLAVLRKLEIDEPRLRTNPVWCLDQLAEALPLPGIKRQLLEVFLRHQVAIPSSIAEEILESERGT